MSTFADRWVSRGQRGGSPTVVNLSVLDRGCYFGKSIFLSLFLYRFILASVREPDDSLLSSFAKRK
jgi:hypothetical protein